ncbi:MAG: DUF29 family protein, partial [Methylocella sp.]
HIRLIFVHLIKLFIEANSQAAPHWRGEIAGFHFEIVERYAPSMRQRIVMDELWRAAYEQSMQVYDGERQLLVAGLGVHSPFGLDDLISDRIDIFDLLRRLQPRSSSSALMTER